MTGQVQERSLVDRFRGAVDGVVGAVESFTADQRLQQYEGYTAFRDALTQEGPLQQSMTAILGEGADRSQMLARLETLAAQDPQIFVKLNAITGAQGFNGFAERIAANPELRQTFSSMLTDSSLPAQNSIRIIDGLYNQVTQSPDFFDQVNSGIDRFPGIVSTVARNMNSNPDGAFAQIQMYMQGQQLFAGLGLDRLLGGIDMQNFGLESIGQIILAIFDGLDNMIGGLINGVSQMFGQGDNIAGTPAAPVAPGAAQPAPRQEVAAAAPALPAGPS